jgi:isopenicillin-N epimerase
MSCGIGMFGLDGADPAKLVNGLESRHAIYTGLMPHEEYTGIRITPSVYTTLRRSIISPAPWSRN